MDNLSGEVLSAGMGGAGYGWSYRAGGCAGSGGDGGSGYGDDAGGGVAGDGDEQRNGGGGCVELWDSAGKCGDERDWDDIDDEQRELCGDVSRGELQQHVLRGELTECEYDGGERSGVGVGTAGVHGDAVAGVFAAVGSDCCDAADGAAGTADKYGAGVFSGDQWELHSDGVGGGVAG